MKMKTSELTGAALDWAVAKAKETGMFPVGYWTDMVQRGTFNPSTKWEHGGPIIAQEGISWHCGNKSSWHAYGYGSMDNISGPTPLIAAMRCYVASKLGEEIEIPEELLK